MARNALARVTEHQSVPKRSRNQLALNLPANTGVGQLSADSLLTNVLYGGRKATNPPPQEEWVQGPLGKKSARRFEIDDSHSTLKGFDGKSSGVLPELIDHPELFEQYPFMNSIPYFLDNEQESRIAGGTTPLDNGDSRMTLYKKNIARANMDPRQVVLHELQHVIQAHEGWLKEGNGHEPYSNIPHEWEASAVENRRDFTPMMRSTEPGYYSKHYTLKGEPGVEPHGVAWNIRQAMYDKRANKGLTQDDLISIGSGTAETKQEDVEPNDFINWLEADAKYYADATQRDKDRERMGGYGQSRTSDERLKPFNQVDLPASTPIVDGELGSGVGNLYYNHSQRSRRLLNNLRDMGWKGY